MDDSLSDQLLHTNTLVGCPNRLDSYSSQQESRVSAAMWLGLISELRPAAGYLLQSIMLT